MQLTAALTVSTGALVICKVGNRTKEKCMSTVITMQLDALWAVRSQTNG